VDAQLHKEQLSWRMSIQIPYRFAYKNWEMTETESARIFLISKERKTLSKIKQFTLDNLFKQLRVSFRFIKILIMHAHALYDLPTRSKRRN
jgi:hypothetical protein